MNLISLVSTRFPIDRACRQPEIYRACRRWAFPEAIKYTPRIMKSGHDPSRTTCAQRTWPVNRHPEVFRSYTTADTFFIFRRHCASWYYFNSKESLRTAAKFPRKTCAATLMRHLLVPMGGSSFHSSLFFFFHNQSLITVLRFVSFNKFYK